MIPNPNPRIYYAPSVLKFVYIFNGIRPTTQICHTNFATKAEEMEKLRRKDCTGRKIQHGEIERRGRDEFCASNDGETITAIRL